MADKALPALMGKLKEGNREEKIFSLHVLAGLAAKGNDLLYGIFKNCFTDTDPWVKLNAIAVCRRRFYSDSMDELLAFAHSASGHLKRVATHAFCALTFSRLDTPLPQLQEWWTACKSKPYQEIVVDLADRAIKRLTSVDEESRALAIGYLKRITKAEIAYDETGDENQRKKSADTWTAWWRLQRPGFTPPPNVWP